MADFTWCMIYLGIYLGIIDTIEQGYSFVDFLLTGLYTLYCSSFCTTRGISGAIRAASSVTQQVHFVGSQEQVLDRLMQGRPHQQAPPTSPSLQASNRLPSLGRCVLEPYRGCTCTFCSIVSTGRRVKPQPQIRSPKPISKTCLTLSSLPATLAASPLRDGLSDTWACWDK
ncbi:hypothetical protein SODALDRAFT_153642 [Sodiomyces alkalinus F11]|uniref:Uncharacterized protein n=1 Tax=Sodiomyces alkalinus (strain CBS 110278 / VKM F-3762 / F11) TaxID=1314773 RepID=A0A3N2PXH6_SODAK|nr:hypothetical protein SODALDRAFT_153642 [Sodiomyces alkalinus F11]ROT39174.1 hypothetical protein SODALDRAFT_153642 [Sodiomyces alkalinus F11]